LYSIYTAADLPHMLKGANHGKVALPIVSRESVSSIKNLGMQEAESKYPGQVTHCARHTNPLPSSNPGPE